jgi:hypothetical protein
MKPQNNIPAVGKQATLKFLEPVMSINPNEDFVVLSKVPIDNGEIVVGHREGKHTEDVDTYMLPGGTLLLWTGRRWKSVNAVIVPAVCPHDRLNEDGICRRCGADCRGAAAA